MDVIDQATSEWLRELETTVRSHQTGALEAKLANVCCVVMALACFGTLTTLSDDIQGGLIQYLQACQDADSGLFSDPCLASSHQENVDEGLLQPYQDTYLALNALDALGVRPLYYLRFMEQFQDLKPIQSSFDTLDWWNASRNTLFILFFLIYQAEVEQNSEAVKQYHALLDWLNEIQDQKTGLYGIQYGADLRDAIVVTCVLTQFLEYAHRPLTHAKQIVDSVLRWYIDTPPSTDFLGRTSYTQLVIIGLLSTLTTLFRYRAGEITEVLLACHKSLQASQRTNDDYITETPSSNMHCSLLALIGQAQATFDRWLHLIASTVIEKTYPDLFPTNQEYFLRRWPLIGYYRMFDTLGADKHEPSPILLRPLPSAIHKSKTSDDLPVVTVVIPCYNLGHYLHEAIESVLTQTLVAVETIIIDDGSTDEYTKVFLRNFSHCGVSIIRQENRGLAAARNEGIRHARGRYICCLDADDRLRPQFLEKAIVVLDLDRNVGLVTGYLQMFDCRDKLVEYSTCKLPDLLVSNQAIEAAVFRRETWELVGGYYHGFSVSGIEDWDLWISILEQGYRAELIPEIVLEYRIRPDQMSEALSDPEIWGQLNRELAARHATSYHKYLAEVVALQSLRWSSIRQWASNLEEGVIWLQHQRDNLHQLVEQRSDTLHEQRIWSNELERAKEWLEEQASNWKLVAEEREQIIELQRDWIQELEQAKAWLAEQASTWRQTAEQRERLIETLQVRLSELESVKPQPDQQELHSIQIVEEHDLSLRSLIQKLRDGLLRKK